MRKAKRYIKSHRVYNYLFADGALRAIASFFIIAGSLTLYFSFASQNQPTQPRKLLFDYSVTTIITEPTVDGADFVPLSSNNTGEHTLLRVYEDGHLICDTLINDEDSRSATKEFDYKEAYLNDRQIDSFKNALKNRNIHEIGGYLQSNDPVINAFSSQRQIVRYELDDGPQTIVRATSESIQTEEFNEIVDVAKFMCLTAKEPYVAEKSTIYADRDIQGEAYANADIATIQTSLDEEVESGINTLENRNLSDELDGQTRVMTETDEGETIELTYEPHLPPVTDLQALQFQQDRALEHQLADEASAVASSSSADQPLQSELKTALKDPDIDYPDGNPADTDYALDSMTDTSIVDRTQYVQYFVPNDVAVNPAHIDNLNLAIDQVDNFYDRELGTDYVQFMPKAYITRGKHNADWYRECNTLRSKSVEHFMKTNDIPTGVLFVRDSCHNSATLAVLINIIFDRYFEDNDGNTNCKSYGPTGFGGGAPNICEPHSMPIAKHHYITAWAEVEDACGIAIGFDAKFSLTKLDVPGCPTYGTTHFKDKSHAGYIPDAERGVITVPSGIQYHYISKVIAHEVGHTFGLLHGHQKSPKEYSFMNYGYDSACGFAIRPNDDPGRIKQNYCHLNDNQKYEVWYDIRLGSTNVLNLSHFTEPAYTEPPAPPPIPTCKNGNPIVPYLFCNDGEWSKHFTTTWAGKTVEIWKNPAGECGTPSGLFPGTLEAQAGYFYPTDCGNKDTILAWKQASVINEQAKKAQKIQDIKPQKKKKYGKPINTKVDYEKFTMYSGNMRTWSEWEKKDGQAYLGYLSWFIPVENQYGLANYNTKKDLNFMGNIWGVVDGEFVAASNMSQHGKTTTRPFVYGPFERPGKSVQNALDGERKLKVCWRVKDLLAEETDGARQSSIRLKVTSNQGAVDWTAGRSTKHNLKGSEFQQICYDNLDIPAGSVNPDAIEYPVHYINGSVAVSEIERWIYYPGKQYRIDLPSYGTFEMHDPDIRQANTRKKDLANNQCEAVTLEEAFGKQIGKGCRLSDARHITIESAVFSSRPKAKRTQREVCIEANLPNDSTFIGVSATSNENITYKHYVRNAGKKNGHGYYCTYFSAETVLEQITLFTNATRSEPVEVFNVRSY